MRVGSLFESLGKSLPWHRANRTDIELQSVPELTGNETILQLKEFARVCEPMNITVGDILQQAQEGVRELGLDISTINNGYQTIDELVDVLNTKEELIGFIKCMSYVMSERTTRLL